MNQRTFFDDEFDSDQQAKRLARRDDPDTSKLAAEHVAKSLTARQQQAYDVISAHPGCTSQELRAIVDWDVHKRVCELVRAGRVKRGAQRICSVTGMRVQTWFPIR